MRSLIIVANPRPESFSHQLAEAYKEGANHGGKSVKILDLYTTDLQLDFLRPETKSEFEEQQPIREELQQMVYEADELVIIHPLWWGGPPAILKNFIDQILTPGFAYRHVRRRGIPKKLDVMPRRLLKGRKVKLFISCDGQRWTNALRLMPYLSMWNLYILRFTGMKLTTFRLFDDMRHRTDIERGKWLARVNRMAAK